MKKILFLDRDGTLITEPPDQQIDQLNKFRLLDNVISSLLILRDAGYRFVMVSNQDGLGTEAFPVENFEPLQTLLLHIFESQGIVFDEVLIDTSFEAAPSENRKPALGLVMHYLRDHNIDWSQSAMVGDRDTDLLFAERLGIRGFKLAHGGLGWTDIVRTLTHSKRFARVCRSTKETQIEVELDLDRNDAAIIHTGIGFFDHMLEQISRHANIALRIHCSGDLHIDEHHTIEDVALALGTALNQALGEKRGIERFGFADQSETDAVGFSLAMDDALARVALDLSGRPYFVFTGQFPRPQVGGLATEMVPHFFRSLCDKAGINLNLQVQGENTHHMVEASFKAFGRGLKMAIAGRGLGVPSTKGVL